MSKIGDTSPFGHKRGASGKLKVEKRTCPKCGGGKALGTSTRLKCTKCKYVYGGEE